MLKDITLGQFFPGNSLLHKADPRAKLILAVVYIILLFVSNNLISFLCVAAFSVLLVYLSKIPIKTILKGIKPILFVLIFTFVINMFFTTGQKIIFEYAFINIYAEGVYKAFIMALRIVLLITVTCLLMSYTTSPIMLTDAIEQLFSPLKKVKVPVHEFAMMMTIALRFIPTLIEETDKIMNAQKTRGADFSEGGLIKKAKALIPVLVPLFVSAFRRADELAVAMECRCYRGGDGRTRMTKLRFSSCDAVLTFIFALLLFCILLCNHFFNYIAY